MRLLYWLFAYLGLMSLSAAFFMGFRFWGGAPVENYYFNITIYIAFILIHLVMTRPWFKKILFGKAEGSMRERRVYIAITIITWGLVLYFHKEVPGPYYVLPSYAEFIGYSAMLVAVFAFFQGMTFDALNGFLGVPGGELSHSEGAETPLMTEGAYASVRHPMYRAFFFLTLSSLLVHPNAAQLFWAGLVVVSFLGFVPLEERYLLKARGDEYKEYMKATPYRVFKGIW